MTRLKEGTRTVSSHDARVVIDWLSRSGLGEAALEKVDQQVRRDHERFANSVSRRSRAELIRQDDFMISARRELERKGLETPEVSRLVPPGSAGEKVSDLDELAF